MVSNITSTSPRSESGQPAWDIARLFPDQGFWGDWDYLTLKTNQLIELTDGWIKVLPMPTPAHQRIVSHLYIELLTFNKSRKLGEALFAPMRVRLRAGKFREPDVMFMLTANAGRKGKEFWNGADLVMEVVSDDPESRERDHQQKRADYAEAGVAEYWIVDPQEQKITLLSLHRGEYLTQGEFAAGQKVESLILPGFALDVKAAFAAADSD